MRDVVPMRGQLSSVPAPQAAPDSVDLRPLSNDADELGDLLFASYRGTIDDEGETLDEQRTEAERTLDGVYGDVITEASLAAYEAGELTACTVITRYQDRPLVAFVLTRPDRQGRGLASWLLGVGADELRRLGHTEWTLAVTNGNPAQRLYERLGFRRDDTLRSG